MCASWFRIAYPPKHLGNKGAPKGTPTRNARCRELTAIARQEDGQGEAALLVSN